MHILLSELELLVFYALLTLL